MPTRPTVWSATCGTPTEARGPVSKATLTRLPPSGFRSSAVPTATSRIPLSKGIPVETLENFVGGRWNPSRAFAFHDVHNPATGETIARTPLSTGAEVDAAVAAAKKAFPAWRDTPPVARAKVLFRFRELLDQSFEGLAATVTRGHGKALEGSRGGVRPRRASGGGACGTPSLMMGYGLENIASGIDCSVLRQPLGVCAAIAPFNFPAMVPLWFLPFAIATGNTFLLKPSEQVPMTQGKIARLLEQ